MLVLYEFFKGSVIYIFLHNLEISSILIDPL